MAFVRSLIPVVLTFWWIREPSGGELGPDIIKYTEHLSLDGQLELVEQDSFGNWPGLCSRFKIPEPCRWKNVTRRVLYLLCMDGLTPPHN